MHKLFTIFLISASLVSYSYAEKIYKRIPFEQVNLSAEDQLIVDYDFTKMKKVQCTAAKAKANISFRYNGHQKMERLPITLESDHIPSNATEALADVKGHLTISVEPGQNEKSAIISCHYAFGSSPDVAL